MCFNYDLDIISYRFDSNVYIFIFSIIRSTHIHFYIIPSPTFDNRIYCQNIGYLHGHDKSIHYHTSNKVNLDTLNTIMCFLEF